MKEWSCNQCGQCCTFIIIPVKEDVDLETEAYLTAHGIVTKQHKLYIPAVCQYLGKDNKCTIHKCKFANCRLAGKKECREGKKGYEIIKKARQSSTKAH